MDPLTILGGIVGYSIYRWLCRDSEDSPAPTPLQTNGVTWEWPRYIPDIKAAFRTVAEVRMGYSLVSSSGSGEVYRVGSIDKVWTAEDDKKPLAEQWGQCTRELEVKYSITPDKTSIEVLVRLAGKILFNEDGQKWFVQNAQMEMDSLGPAIDEYFRMVSSPAASPTPTPTPADPVPDCTGSTYWRSEKCRSDIRATVRQVLQMVGYTLFEDNVSVEIYSLGLLDKRWSSEDEAKPEEEQWQACTRYLIVAYSDDPEVTALSFRAQPGFNIGFNEVGKRWFLARAQAEIETLERVLTDYYATMDGLSSTQRWCLEQLELDATATWPDIQAAYRAMCKKYHPDTASGRDVPPHVIHLMEEKFNTVSKAYHYLKAYYQANGEASAANMEA